MKDLLVAFLRNTAFGTCLMIAMLAAGIVFRTASGVDIGGVRIDRIVLVSLVGGTALGIGLTLMRRRH